MSPQKKLASFGAAGRSVRVFVEKGLVRVQWREAGRRRTESWPDSRDNRVRARSFAEGKAAALDRRGLVLEPLTVHELWTKYVAAVAPAWRPATARNAANHWRLFTLLVGDTTRADTITPEVMDEIMGRLRKMPARAGTHGETARRAVSVAATCAAVKRVFAWAGERKLLADNPLAAWRPRLSKDERRPLQPDEYRPDELRQIIGAVDRRSSRQWRAWVTFVLCATTGRRQRAVLGLEWSDVDLVGRTVTFRATLDKLGREAVVPLSRAAVHALRVARVWGGGDWASPPRSRYVLPAVQERRGDQPWTYQAANQALREAETRAGVPHRPFRALHGFRRSVVSSILEATGNLILAGEFVGDHDVRTLRRSYVKIRPQRLASAADIASNQLATEAAE